MFNARIRWFVCLFLCCLFVQGSKKGEQKLAPKFNHEQKGTEAQGFPSRHHKIQRYSLDNNSSTSMNKKFNKQGISFNTTQMPGNTTKDSFLDTSKSFSDGLRLVTSIGFSVAAICHLSVLITYGLFAQLRNVPGLNLMNLCLSLALQQVIWVVAIFHFDRTILCEVFGILLHYLREVSFFASTAISYHICRVFSQPFVGRIANRTRSKFIKYFIFVWLTPAVLVAICIALDKTQIFPVDYGTNCWIGNKNAELYLYITPLSLLMLYNIYKFIQTALSLSRHYRQTHTIQRKKGKQNLLVCAKIAALVSCPCLLLFLAVLFPDVEAFDYLYVLFVCLQAVYIAQMFLFNRRIAKLYQDLWRSRVRSPKSEAVLKNVAVLFPDSL